MRVGVAAAAQYPSPKPQRILSPILWVIRVAAIQRRCPLPDCASHIQAAIGAHTRWVATNRARAADLGVDSTDIATALRIMVGGDERVSRFHDEKMNEDYDVQVRLQQGDRNDAETIARDRKSVG